MEAAEGAVENTGDPLPGGNIDGKVTDIVDGGDETTTTDKEIPGAGAGKETKLSEEGKAEDGGPVDGDPVLITTGKYIQKEEDLFIPTVNGYGHSFSRMFTKSYIIQAGLGYGWVISTDTRIIRGYEALSRDTADAYKINVVDKVYNDVIALKKAYITGHGLDENKTVADVRKKYEAQKAALNALLPTAKKNMDDAKALYEKLKNTNQKVNAETEKNRAIAVYNKIVNRIDSYTAVFTEITNQENAIARLEGKYAEYLNVYNVFFLPKKQMQENLEQVNNQVNFPGTSQMYYGIGFDKLTLMKEDGTHSMYIQSNINGIMQDWIPLDTNETQFSKIVQNINDGSYILFDKGGEKKYYSAKGLYIKYEDPNGNTISFARDASGKLTGITTSLGETFTVTTSGANITRIASTRDPSYAVSYGYTGTRLSSVTDTDGDTVKFEYDGDYLQRMIKSDNSSVNFIYGLIDGDGQNLTTSTVNEEGEAEYFVYDKSNNLTEYIDHSGKRTKHFYNSNHKTTRKILPDGTDISYTYDANGNIYTETTNLDTVTYGYDVRGNKTLAVYSDGSTEQWDYTLDKVSYYKDRDGKTASYMYDTKGNLLSINQGGVQVFSAVYDTRGFMTQSTEGNLVSTYVYDAYGNVTKRTQGSEAEKTAESWTYDGRNRVTSYTNALNEKTSYSYVGKETTVTYADGLKVTYLMNSRKDLVKVTQTDTFTGVVRVMDYIYDRRHKLIETKINGKTSAKYTYKGAGELESELYFEDGEGWKKEYVYDSAGRISQIKQFKADALGNRTGTENEVYVQSITYEKNGFKEIISSIDPLGRTSNSTLDQWKRVTSVTNPLGETAIRLISNAGRVTELENSFGGFYTYEYDNAGRMSGVIEKESTISMKVSYNADGTVDTQTDQKGNVTSYTYNDLRQLTKIQGVSTVTHYEYDDGGRVVLVLTGGNGTKESAEAWTEYKYENSGRTVRVNSGDAVFTTQNRNAFGDVTSVIDGEGNVTQYKYNDKGQLTDVIDPNGYTTSYAYNALGKVKSMWYADSQTRDASGNLVSANASIKYEYNYLGLVTMVTDKKGIEWSGVYDKAGRLIKETGRLGLNKEYTYDVLDRITEVKSGGVVIEKYNYTNRGKTITYTDGKGSTYTYTKDSYGKLTTEVNRLGVTQSYTYEKDGSVKTKTDFESDIKTTTYNDASRTKTVTYSDGRKEVFTYTMRSLIQTAETKTGKIVYAYNKAGLLIKQEDLKAGETTTYTYDKAGRRTSMNSGNREVRYVYGKAGELLSINDNKQRLSVTYKYDSLYRETERVFGNGVVQKTQYTVTGQTELITEVNSRGELLRAEGYVYDEGGRRIYTISEKGELTSYTYDAQGSLSKVLYPYTEEKKEADKIEAEEEGVHYLEGNVKPVNIFLSLEDKALIVPLLEKMGWGRSSYLTTTQVLWQETYTYDANGNRESKTTPFGTIRYWYDKENRLVHSGSDEGRGSDYTYDKNGNLLTKTNLYKTEEYSYTGTNRMSMSTVTDHIKKTKTITHYDYDAFGRRTLVQDEGGKIIRTLYDGLSFDIIREQETFADGYFTNTSDTGIAWGAVSEGDGSRYRYIGDDAPAAQTQNGYSVTATNRASSKVALYANGQAVGVTRSSNYASSERSYFGTDLMGTVRSATTDSGSAEYYEYDVFGKPYGESISDYAYTGKPYDPVTGMYNYGYRDYVPQTARFSTIDPIRDGSNWFAYCNGDPVNFRDAWGLSASDVTFPSNAFTMDPPNPFSGGGIWPGVDRQVTRNPDDFHCDIYAWNAALDHSLNPRGQNGENPDLDDINVDTWYDSFPSNRSKGVPPQNTKGYAFYDNTDDNVDNPSHMEFYDNTNYPVGGYIQYKTEGILPPDLGLRPIYQKENKNWTYVPLN